MSPAVLLSFRIVFPAESDAEVVPATYPVVAPLFSTAPAELNAAVWLLLNVLLLFDLTPAMFTSTSFDRPLFY